MAERATIIAPASSGVGAPTPGSYVDWPAIFAGAVVATAIGVVFAGFGAALGLSALSFERNEGSGTWSLILTGLWALVTVLVSYGAGGYIAGRMRRRVEGATEDEVKARDSIQGMVVWGLGVLVGVWVVGSLIGSTVNALGNVAAGTAQAVGSVAQGAGNLVGNAAGAVTDAATEGGESDTGLDLSGFDPIAAINNRLLRGTGEQIDADAASDIAPVARDIVFEVARTGELSDENRQLLVEEVAANSTLTEQEINARVDQAVTEVTQLRDEAAQRVEQAAEAAREAADNARRAAVLTGFLVATGFAIALAAAMYGAGAGGRHRDEGRIWAGFRSY